MFRIGKIEFKKNKTVIIAEAGVNHNGKLKFGKRLIDEAKKAGADIIKFQTYKAKKLTTKNAPRFWNWQGELKKNGTQYDSYSNLDSFTKNEYRQLINYCKKKKIEFLSTPFDEESANMLVEIGMKGFKVASSDITNHPFLEFLAKKKLPILLSTGASSINEIKEAVRIINKSGNKKILIMQCTLCYPTKPQDANLLAINDIKRNFPKYLVGLSDHTLGIEIASASVLYGVSAIEKHFTFNKKLLKSADHWLSIDPGELKKLVENVRTINLSMGNGKKIALKCENQARKFARRSIVANKKITIGEVLTKNKICFKRPGTGISPSLLKKVLGKRAKKEITYDKLIMFKDLK